MGSMKSFIKAVRKSKTIADERAVIKKESAAIRTSFRDPNLDQTTRRINISKLLYLYIMGEKTHFGQVECLKLLVSQRFADKRLGYLATMLLLDENQEVLTLLTNSLDNDMQHPNAFIVGLALCCLGNIASSELARDLYVDVEKILTTSNNAYLKKKSTIVAAKLIEKEPDLAEIFITRVPTLLNDKQPGPLLGTLKLIQSLYRVGTDSDRKLLIGSIPKLVEHLKRASTSGYMPDYDVMGITDPFLQVSLIQTIRVLAVDPSCPSSYLESVNDILTQVASNIENGKNSAHAILYECIKAIFAIQSDQSLKILGVNLLGKFLSTKDNNTRYVALDTLLMVINIEPQAVQRHRTTIVNCLADGDISIRRRALELLFAIVNEQNIRVLARELLQFLEKCTENDLKLFITSQLTLAANKYSPNDKWHFDTLTKMLKLAGNFVTPDIISNILALIVQCNDMELKRHVVLRLFTLWSQDPAQYGLLLVTVWCMGEYYDLIDGQQIEEGKKTVTEKTVLQMFDLLLNNSTFSEQELTAITSYILTADIKLTTKFKKAESIEALRQILNSRSQDPNLEIQIRAVEYQEIFALDLALRKGLLARMPAPPVKEREAISLNKSSSGKLQSAYGAGHGNSPVSSSGHREADVNGGPDLLLDLMDDGPSVGKPVTQNENDLLSDIFGTSAGNPSSEKPVVSALPGVSRPNAISGFKNEHLEVVFVPERFTGNGQATIEAIIKGSGATRSGVVTNVQLLIAVPKTQKLAITSGSTSDTVNLGDANSTILQTLSILGKAGAKVKLRVKLNYTYNGVNQEAMFDFAKFPSCL